MTMISQNNNITQRELSKKLGVSVSTVNILINKMIREGLIKVTQISQKQFFYMLTPVGIMEKAKKTIRYLRIHYRAIFETKEKIKDLLNILHNENDVIYILINNDEMSDIILTAVHEFKSRHSKLNIKIVNSIVDIEVEKYKSPILIYMQENDSNINEKIYKNYEEKKNCLILNLAEIL